MLGKKILLIAIQFPPYIGGVPNFYYHLAVNWNKNGIVVFTAKEEGAEEVDRAISFPIYRSAYLSNYQLEYSLRCLIKSIVLFWRLLKTILKERIDVLIETGNPVLMFYCYLFKLLLGKEYGIFYHGDSGATYVKLKTDFLRRFLINHGKFIIANSNFSKERIIAKNKVSADKIIILYPGVDTSIFSPVDKSDALISSLNCQNKKVILTIGRLDKRKGQDMVLKSLPYVVKEFGNNFHYIIIGSGSYKDELIKIVNEFKLGEYVTFLGYVPDKELPAFYNCCDIFIMPNRELEDGDAEGFGIVFLEANACGKPVIGGRCNGAIDAIEDGKTGLLVNPYSEKDIAEKIVFLLRNNETARKLGENGRKRTYEQFQWAPNIRNFNKIFLETFFK